MILINKNKLTRATSERAIKRVDLRLEIEHTAASIVAHSSNNSRELRHGLRGKNEMLAASYPDPVDGSLSVGDVAMLNNRVVIFSRAFV